MRTRSPQRSAEQGRNPRKSLKERGVVGIWMAITTMLLLAFVGLGLDSSYWYWQGWKQQQAADQASLAAAVFLPDRPDLALAAANQSAQQNGYVPEVAVGSGQKANEVTVAVRRTHQSFLMRLMGKTSQEIVRTGTAQYTAPLTLGSPYARLGNDPEDTSGTNLNFWLSQHGPWVPKHNGDRYAADNCIADGSVVHPTPFGCSAGTATRGLSEDYQRLGQYGYRYAVDVTSIAAGKDLVFEVFDGVTADVGTLCDPKSAPYSGKLPGPSERAALSAYVGDADVRYRPGTEAGGLPWCTSDLLNLGGGMSRNTQYMDTEFAVYSQERSVATGALVQNTTPPTTAPPAPSTTLGPGGGSFVSAPCSSPTTSATLNIRNTRATPLQVYLVDNSCQEVLSGTIAAGGTSSFTTSSGNRYRMYDATSLELVSDYTVPVNTNPAVNKYARRSLEPAGFRDNWLSTSGGFSNTGTATAAASAHTWEITPALNGQASCNSFKTVDGSDLFITYVATGSPTALLPDDTTAARRNAASWCSGPSAAYSGSTTFAGYGLSNTFLWRDPVANTVGAQTLAAAANGTLDWNVNLPFAPQTGEPVPNGAWAEMSMESGRVCLEPASNTNNALLRQQACAASSQQNFNVQPDGTVWHQMSGMVVRPSGGVNMTIGTATGATNEKWTASVVSGGFLTLRNTADSTDLTNSCDATVGRTLEHLAAQPAACTYLRMRLRDFISPVLVTAGSPAPLVVNMATHINNAGTCSTGGSPADLTVSNTRTDPVGVYALVSGCMERYLGEVPAGGSKTFTGLYTTARIRVYDAGTQFHAVADFGITTAAQTTTVTSTGPASPCTTTTGAATTFTLTNLRVSPVRLVWVDGSCNEITYSTVVSGGSNSVNSFVGHRWKVIDTYTGKTLRSFAALGGAQTYTEKPDTLTAGACSTPSGTAATMTIVNERTTGLELRRVEDDCTVVVDRSLAAGSTTAVTTYVGQRWKLYNLTGEVVQDITVSGDDTYTISEPSNFVWDPNAGNVSGSVLICSRVETTYPLDPYSAGNQRSGSLSQLINPYDGVHDNGAGTRDPYADSFTLGFRRWRQFCKIPAADVAIGRYTITVRTNLNDESAGNNSFSLRAAWLGSLPTDRSETGIRLSAMENLPVFVNLGGASTSTLYLTRLLPVHAGRTLRIELYDIGDTASGTVNVQILPPTDAGMTTWPCGMTLESADGTFPPPNSTAGTCSVNNLTRADYNGAVVRFDIPIPSTYTCTQSVATNCWTKVKLTFNGGQPTDRTTWSAAVLGDPLRLVK